jgi:hypothetical protein
VAYLAVPPYLAAITPQSTRPYLFGVAGAAYVASTALGSLLGGLMPPTIRSLAPGFDLDLTDATIYRSALAIGAACSGLGIPFLLGARPPGGMPAHASLAPSDLASRVSRTVQASIDTWRVRETRDSTIRFLATDGLIRLGGNMVVPFFSVYFIRELGASEAWYGTMRVVERTIEVVAMLGVAPVAARLGPVATIAWTQAVSVPMLLGLGFAPDLLVATAVFLVRGTLMEMTVPLRDNFMMDRLPTEARATGSGAVLLSGYALAFVGVRIGGDLNEAGLRHVAYLAAAVLYFGGAIAFARLFAGVGDKSPRRMSDDVQAPRARSSRSTGLALTENNPTNGAHGL